MVSILSSFVPAALLLSPDRSAALTVVVGPPDLRILLPIDQFRPQWVVAGTRPLRYFKPSFFPVASRVIDSRMRLSRVSCRLDE